MSADPESSWSNGSTENDAVSEIARSGVTFHVKFYGYVPVGCSLSNQETVQKDLITKACIRTVVKSEHTEVFKKMFHAKKVSSFVRLDGLNANMVVTASTITLFYIEGKITRLIARYSTAELSFATFEFIDTHLYFGFIIKCQEKRECLVLKLTSLSAKNHITHILKTADESKQRPYIPEARLKPAQNFTLTKQMSPFHHGTIEEYECERLLIHAGDFLFRDSRDPNFYGILVVRKLFDESLITTKYPPLDDAEMFKLLQSYQIQGQLFKRPVMKLNSL